MTITAMRSFFAALVMMLYMRKPHITFSPAVILAGLSLSATTILFVFANKLTTAANAIVLQDTAPVFIVIFSIVFLKKRPRAADIIAVLVVFAGMVLFFIDKLQSNALLGNILAVLAGVSFAGVFLFNKMPGANPEESILLSHIINAVAGLPFVIGGITFQPSAWLAIVLLGIFQLGIAYILFSKGIRLTLPISASLIAMLETAFKSRLGVSGYRRKTGRLALFGGAVVLVTIVIYNILIVKQASKDGHAQTDGVSAPSAPPATQ